MSTDTKPQPVDGEIVWSRNSDLDPTPVYQLEQWMRDYDPRTAGELDRGAGGF